MLGAVGFIIGALCIAGFAVTASKAYTLVPPRKLQLFVTAFGCLAAAMLAWAFALIVNTTTATNVMMLTSDGLLLFATGCMVHLLLKQSDAVFTVLIALAGSMFLGLRAFVDPPTAYAQNGLLYFNLATPVRTTMIGLLIIVWIPAVIYIAGYMAKDKSLPGIQNILTLSFISLVAVTALFVTARRSVTIIAFFTAIAAIFLAMTVFNMLVLKIHKLSGGRHAAKPAR